MTPVFGHGRLRLYLLKLLDEAPRHGYEVIRLLEERFEGLYAPSAGTVYPRLAKLEKEGLVAHSSEGGRKVYRLTDAGRTELADRQGELAELEIEIRDSVAQLAGAIREDVRDSAQDLRDELWGAAAPKPHSEGHGDPWAGPWGDKEAWQRAKEEFTQFKVHAKEQARRAKEQERAAKAQAKAAEEEARRLREQARASRGAAQQEALRIKRRVEQQVREHAARGDWSTGLAEGLSELTKGLAGLADAAKWGQPTASTAPADRTDRTDRINLDKEDGAPQDAPPVDLPAWTVTDPAADPARELERLLDRFRDQVRDAARDSGGVTADQLTQSRSALAAVAERLRGILG
ncbi:PadR family transcriptional regulator [Kitasatospora sp. MAP5-34]|uniref:PadR family transcriptional regulator n=1 Tax=Kitasatospora sp. MAP5-34 TaxID=3035102 RepID=UPI002473B0CE|nr:PadR family transcriptional regulator [Kitasatospora sp. MAP5-34]MDH6575621.1 DNA-binding PadR family transcriptional regulator [Kitasatospora sp. MAP5-34]